MTQNQEVSAWTVLVPLKSLATAKSRLRHAFLEIPRSELVMAMARSTIEAAVASPLVHRLIVVTNEAGGLNASLLAAAQGLTGPLVVIPADLPALRPAELTEALTLATVRSFVPDADGLGTVLLAAPDGRLWPQFGPGSAAAHERSGAVRLEQAWPGLRRDVDTEADLRAVQALGWTHAGHRLGV